MREKDKNELLNTFRKSRGLNKVALNDDGNNSNLSLDETDGNKEKPESEKLSDKFTLVPLREAENILVDIINVH